MPKIKSFFDQFLTDILHHGWRKFWIFDSLRCPKSSPFLPILKRYSSPWLKNILNFYSLKCHRSNSFWPILVQENFQFKRSQMHQNTGFFGKINSLSWLKNILVFLQQSENNFIPQCSFIFVKFSISRTSLYPSSGRADTCLQHIFKE